MPSRIALTWPVNSLTETGLGGGAVRQSLGFQTVGGWNGWGIAERGSGVFLSETLKSRRVSFSLAAKPRGFNGHLPFFSTPMSH